MRATSSILNHTIVFLTLSFLFLNPVSWEDFKSAKITKISIVTNVTKEEQPEQQPVIILPQENIRKVPVLNNSVFLTAPIKFTRISDGYTLHRWHPILHISRPHYGIDYVAPTGTPIRAIANGRIIFAGWNGGYGKTIMIQHKHHYQSLYAHMSRIHYFLKPGQFVLKGQIIGYVGNTGLSTGPHLHFGLYKHGKAINPNLVLNSVQTKKRSCPNL